MRYLLGICEVFVRYLLGICEVFVRYLFNFRLFYKVS